MKTLLKGLGIAVIVALVLSAIAVVALAQGPAGQPADGTCTVDGQPLGSGWARSGRMNWNSAPVQQGLGANEEAPCDDFVDADGDGVCDLHGEQIGEGQMRGEQLGEQLGEGQVRGPMGWNRSFEQQGLGANEEAPCDDFVDADGDGMCDLHGEQLGEGQARGEPLGTGSATRSGTGRMGRR